MSELFFFLLTLLTRSGTPLRLNEKVINGVKIPGDILTVTGEIYHKTENDSFKILCST